MESLAFSRYTTFLLRASCALVRRTFANKEPYYFPLLHFKHEYWKKEIGKKLNMKINKSSRHLKSASDDFNHTLLRLTTKLNRVVFN